MDTLQAISNAFANMGKPVRVFDWDAAARLIKSLNAREAEAGLAEDWEWTAGSIYDNGEIIFDEYTYLASNWATPQIVIDGQSYDCYKLEHEVPEWNAETKWPASAVLILSGDIPTLSND